MVFEVEVCDGADVRVDLAVHFVRRMPLEQVVDRPVLFEVRELLAAPDDRGPDEVIDVAVDLAYLRDAYLNALMNPPPARCSFAFNSGDLPPSAFPSRRLIALL